MPPTAPILAFDIETIPDVAGLRRLYGLPDSLSERDVVTMCQRLLRQARGNDFFPLHLQRVVCISCAFRKNDSLEIKTLPLKQADDEATAIQAFFDVLKKYQPTIVSWNGSGFDLPVLNHRAMIHQVAAPGYRQTDGDFKWNNYISRYHDRHTDLMDVLAMYQPRGGAGLNDLAVLCGLPGKIGVGGGGVWESWLAGDVAGIRRYCEVDVLLTYLLYARYLHFCGKMNWDEEAAFARAQLAADADASRWQEFLTQWQPSQPGQSASGGADGILPL